ncbi:hypothetical protein FB45DRAFT_139773 [Roridomyces roridus]|uniref:Phenazine biosynthesis protein n=1 Tax=Roridomyces roridus TaxID=1738132 RepID=A0AAD7BIA7_9AGAR|nr:hypothetical protein FB45DRAFT_139773 [Roridomyces roridus]
MATDYRLKFTTLDVFTSTRYIGNPLAIVHVPPSIKLTQDEKQRVAREFNFSETVFHHEDTVPAVIDIFTTTEELPFAGHPTVGTGFYLLSKASPTVENVTLRTKAGDIPVVRTDSGGARLQVPIDFKEHAPQRIGSVKQQPGLKDTDYVNGREGAEACASIVKGMTFLLLELASEDALGRMQPYAQRLEIPNKEEVLGEWGVGFQGVYAFYEDGGRVRTRMFDAALEDPATGSAASALGGFLGRRKGLGVHEFQIVQGVEMGRRSEIRVRVEIGEDGEVRKIELEGEAVEVMQGVLNV